MNTPELRLVLKTCFSLEALQTIVPYEKGPGDLYDVAIESILAEDEAGEALTQRLDEWSAAQREKIRAIKARDLRTMLSVDFLEPGKKLGLILWALLRDDRLSARNLASEISGQFADDTASAPGATLTTAEPDRGLDDSFGDIEKEAKDLKLYSEDEIDSLISDPELESPAPSQESDEISEDEVNQLIESLSDENQEPEDPQEKLAFPLEEEASDEEALNLDTLEFDSDEDSDDETLSTMDDLIAKLSEDDDDDDDDLDEIPLIEFLDEDEDEDEDEALVLDEEDLSDLEDVQLALDEENEDNFAIAEDAAPPNVVHLGGIDISLRSLKKACERVFDEPVELVTDDNLTQQDKIVVIGQQCGVRVLNGPRYQVQPHKGIAPTANEPVPVLAESVQLALSRIYGEPVELVPDPQLLQQGTVVFTGKNTGLGIVHQERTKIEMPNWVSPDDLQGDPTGTARQIQDLQSQLHELNERLANLEASGAAAASAPSPPPSTPPPEDAAKDDELDDEPIALEDIESEELEPVPENAAADDDEELDDDILSAIASQEEQEDSQSAEKDAEADELDDNLLSAISTEEDPSAEPDSEDDEVNLDDLEELDLDNLTLDEEESESDIQETGQAPETESKESDVGEEELDLDSLEDLDLDSDEEEQEKTSLGDLDIDLDDLESELGEGEEEDDSKSGEPDEPQAEAQTISAPQEDDLDLDLSELEEENEPEAKAVFNGDRILLLGGEAKHQQDYENLFQQLGASGEFFPTLADLEEEAINELVDGSDVIMTLSDEAFSDPGILTAANYAQAQNKRLFQHHSASPSSVKKKLTQLVEEGKV